MKLQEHSTRLGNLVKEKEATFEAVSSSSELRSVLTVVPKNLIINDTQMLTTRTTQMLIDVLKGDSVIAITFIHSFLETST